jgi:hypothetical protein
VAYRGAYSVTFTVNVGAAFAPGTSFLCKARAVPNAPALNAYSLQALPAVSSTATMTGSWANCTVELPFSWIGDNPGSLALLSYEIDAISAPGAQAVPLRIAEAIGVPYPSPGGSSRLSISLAF